MLLFGILVGSACFWKHAWLRFLAERHEVGTALWSHVCVVVVVVVQDPLPSWKGSTVQPRRGSGVTSWSDGWGCSAPSLSQRILVQELWADINGHSFADVEVSCSCVGVEKYRWVPSYLKMNNPNSCLIRKIYLKVVFSYLPCVKVPAKFEPSWPKFRENLKQKKNWIFSLSRFKFKFCHAFLEHGTSYLALAPVVPLHPAVIPFNLVWLYPEEKASQIRKVMLS